MGAGCIYRISCLGLGGLWRSGAAKGGAGQGGQRGRGTCEPKEGYFHFLYGEQMTTDIPSAQLHGERRMKERMKRERGAKEGKSVGNSEQRRRSSLHYVLDVARQQLLRRRCQQLLVCSKLRMQKRRDHICHPRRVISSLWVLRTQKIPFSTKFSTTSSSHLKSLRAFSNQIFKPVTSQNVTFCPRVLLLL